MNRIITTVIVYLVFTGNHILSAPSLDLDEETQSNLVLYEQKELPPVELGKEKPVTPYIIEITRKYVKFQAPKYPPQIFALTAWESEQIQKLSMGFVMLLNSSNYPDRSHTPPIDWKRLNPTITLSPAGISISFDDIQRGPTKDEFANPSKQAQALWEFLTTYVKKILENKANSLKVTPHFGKIEFPPIRKEESFTNFINILWKMIKLSVEYSEFVFDHWATTSEPEEDRRPTSGTMYTYDDMDYGDSLTGREFGKRRRDTDSIYYGRGIV